MWLTNALGVDDSFSAIKPMKHSLFLHKISKKQSHTHIFVDLYNSNQVSSST